VIAAFTTFEAVAGGKAIKIQVGMIERWRRATSNWLALVPVVAIELTVCQALHTKDLASSGQSVSCVAISASDFGNLRVCNASLVCCSRVQGVDVVWWLTAHNRQALLHAFNDPSRSACDTELLAAACPAISGESFKASIRPTHREV
jgi:hypothetical protein